jgi:hypothetical protein
MPYYVNYQKAGVDEFARFSNIEDAQMFWEWLFEQATDNDTIIIYSLRP